jgi:hypothetical protein
VQHYEVLFGSQQFDLLGSMRYDLARKISGVKPGSRPGPDRTVLDRAVTALRRPGRCDIRGPGVDGDALPGKQQEEPT